VMLSNPSKIHAQKREKRRLGREQKEKMSE
jgi:hypothetical protein